jgi:hypothetical protein
MPDMPPVHNFLVLLPASFQELCSIATNRVLVHILEIYLIFRGPYLQEADQLRTGAE